MSTACPSPWSRACRFERQPGDTCQFRDNDLVPFTDTGGLGRLVKDPGMATLVGDSDLVRVDATDGFEVLRVRQP
jgi:hypothetical protein